MKLTNSEILGLQLTNPEDTGSTITIREYLCYLLNALWDQRESFSGKRPFGNSSWEYDLYVPLIKAEVVKGKLDEDGDIKEFNQTNESKANKIIFDVIRAMCLEKA